MLLTCLHRNASVLAVAAVNLQALLIGLDIHLDARSVTRHGQDRQIRRLRRRVPRPVKYEGIVVSSAIETAEVGVENVCAKLLGRGEIEECGVADSADHASGDFNVIDADVAVRVWHRECVVENSAAFRVDEGAEVPIYMVC